MTEAFTNRLRKTARHLGKWARRERITCYRLYDRDIPEVPITVDTYEGALVINDYRHNDRTSAPPGKAGPFDRGGGDAWLEDHAEAARVAMAATEVFIKQRERLVGRREGHQYERLETPRGVWRVVGEGGHKFRVNLSDYVDTGLFLDHRITRARAAAERATTMLNLFGYTGAFTVYGAAAGMRTTTVDLSNTYLDWARENLALNQLTGDVVHADVREFLADAKRAGRRWDLVVVDPPTFSNSKRMDYTWDVQRDHRALLDDVLAVTARGGVVWFSTNRKRFKLDELSVPVTDETYATTPPDFQHRPHHAFRLDFV